MTQLISTAVREMLNGAAISSPDVFTTAYDSDAGDGLPVAHVDEKDVAHALDVLGMEPDKILGIVPPLRGVGRAGDVVYLSLLAGCTVDHIPVVAACIRALGEPSLNPLGVLTTTGSATYSVIVNGPIRTQLGFSGGSNFLGGGCRSNAVVGRALGFITRALGGARRGTVDMATMGQPAKYTCCFAENEEMSPYTPLHAERGFDIGQDTVTLVAIAGTIEIVNVFSEKSPNELLQTVASALAAPYAVALDSAAMLGGGMPLVAISPEWCNIFHSQGLTKSTIRSTLFELASCSLAALPPAVAAEIRRRRRDEGDPNVEQELRVAAVPDDILLVVAGGVGIKQTVFPSWNGRTRAVTVAI